MLWLPMLGIFNVRTDVVFFIYFLFYFIYAVIDEDEDDN